MKITITDKNDILSPLAKVCSVVEKRNTLQVLSNIYLHSSDGILTLKSTDLEISMEAQVPVKENEQGEVSVSAKSFLDIIKELPDKPINITTTENHWVTISCGDSKFNIVGLPAEDFPSLPLFESAKFVPVDQEILRQMIDHTFYAVSTDETRYQMNGIYLDPKNQTRMVGLDGQRLAFFESSLFGKKPDFLSRGIIIPRKGVSEIKKMLDSEGDLTMSLEGSHLILKTPNITLTIRLIEGHYPEYDQVIPKNHSFSVKVDRQNFLNSLKRVSLLANQLSKGVVLNLFENKLKVSTNNPDLGDAHETIDAEYSGEEFEIAFNATYLTDTLSVLSTKDVDIQLNGRMNPGIIRSEEEPEYLSVIMPMRL